MSARPAGAVIVSAPGSRLEAEQAKDIWDMSQLGHTGRLHFTAIHQPWLRAAAKEWAMEDLLHHRGATVTSTMQAHVAALAELSESLHSHRSDHGRLSANWAVPTSTRSFNGWLTANIRTGSARSAGP